MATTVAVVLWIFSAICFGLGAIGVPAKIGWTDAGLMFAAIAIAWTTAQ